MEEMRHKEYSGKTNMGKNMGILYWIYRFIEGNTMQAWDRKTLVFMAQDVPSFPKFCVSFSNY